LPLRDEPCETAERRLETDSKNQSETAYVNDLKKNDPAEYAKLVLASREHATTPGL